jgi:DNA-binding HxlR family transcriptional regulator
MKRKNLIKTNCPIARALSVVGEWWSLLILRDAFGGTQRFEEFQESLGIPRNTLTERLSKLVEHGILDKHPLKEDGKRLGYALTPKGKELLPVVAALRQWGNQHVPTSNPSAVTMIDRRDGSRVELRLELVSTKGRTVPLDKIQIVSRRGRKSESSSEARS